MFITGDALEVKGNVMISVNSTQTVSQVFLANARSKQTVFPAHARSKQTSLTL